MVCRVIVKPFREPDLDLESVAANRNKVLVLQLTELGWSECFS